MAKNKGQVKMPKITKRNKKTIGTILFIIGCVAFFVSIFSMNPSQEYGAVNSLTVGGVFMFVGLILYIFK